MRGAFGVPKGVYSRPTSGMGQDIYDFFPEELKTKFTGDQAVDIPENELDDDLRRRAWETYFWVNWMNSRLPVAMRRLIASDLRAGPSPDRPYLIDRVNRLLDIRAAGGPWYKVRDDGSVATDRVGRLERIGEERKVLEASIKERAGGSGFDVPKEPLAPSFQDVLKLNVPNFDFVSPPGYVTQTTVPAETSGNGSTTTKSGILGGNVPMILGGIALAGIGLYFLSQKKRG